MRGFCEHCFNWGEILDETRMICIDCREKEIGKEMRAERSANESVRALSERNARGRE